MRYLMCKLLMWITFFANSCIDNIFADSCSNEWGESCCFVLHKSEIVSKESAETFVKSQTFKKQSILCYKKWVYILQLMYCTRFTGAMLILFCTLQSMAPAEPFQGLNFMLRYLFWAFLWHKVDVAERRNWTNHWEAHSLKTVSRSPLYHEC